MTRSESAQGRVWRLLRTGYDRAAWNMALDEALQTSVLERGSRPVLRFYGWRPPGVSLGYFQAVEDSINIAACVQRGYDVVRRPTGGRAILHDDELTYSVVLPEAELAEGHSVRGSYRELSRALEYGMSLLGLRTSRGRDGAASDRRLLPAACFAKAARADMVFEGRKIIGSAQTRRRGVILQHGSVPLRLNQEEILAVLSPEAQIRDAALLSRAAVGVAQALGRDLGWEELAEALATGFAETFDLTLVESEVTGWERELAERLVEEKYGTEAWNLQVPRGPRREATTRG